MIGGDDSRVIWWFIEKVGGPRILSSREKRGLHFCGSVEWLFCSRTPPIISMPKEIG